MKQKSTRQQFIVAASILLASSGIWPHAKAESMDMALTVREPGKSGRMPALVTTGIPFARGALRDTGTLAVRADGKAIPAQFRMLMPWDDGSVRWALMDTQLPVGQGEAGALMVSAQGGNPAPTSPVVLEDGQERVSISTGPIAFAIPKETGGLIEYVKQEGRTLVNAKGRGAFLILEDGREVAAARPDEVVVEESSPMRAVVRIRGTFPDAHDELMRYTARVTAWAGQARVHVHFWLENHGAMGYGSETKPEWFSFDSMAIELGLGLGDAITASAEGVQAQNRFRLLQRCLPFHNRERRGGAPFYTWNDFVYTVTGDNRELKQGDRTGGVVELQGNHGRMVAAIREFWQNFDKAIELDRDKLLLWLWPSEGQWPRQRHWRWPGGGMDTQLVAMGENNKIYRYPGGLRKGHEFVLDFSDRTVDEIGAELNMPLFALASAEHYAVTGAAPGLFAPPDARVEKHREANFKLASWGRMQRSASDPDSPTSVFAARKQPWLGQVGSWVSAGQWFGWMDFGDLSIPGRGQVGVDEWSHHMYLNALRFGDVHALQLGSQMVRHTVDVDQLWSDRDSPRNRGLQKRGGGARFAIFPEFHTTQLNRDAYQPRLANLISGLVLHYMLTGNHQVREACHRYANALIEVWQELDDPALTETVHTMAVYGAMFELTGQRKWLEHALALFRNHIVPLWESQGPHLHREGHQVRSQSYAREDQAYCLAIQRLCELHALTGDEQLLQLLKEGCEREFHAQSFFEAPIYLSGLFAYVGLKTGNREYLTRASSLFAQSFPESRSPPVFMPNNSTWHADAGNLLRSGHLLQYAWWKTGP